MSRTQNTHTTLAGEWLTCIERQNSDRDVCLQGTTSSSDSSKWIDNLVSDNTYSSGIVTKTGLSARLGRCIYQYKTKAKISANMKKQSKQMCKLASRASLLSRTYAKYAFGQEASEEGNKHTKKLERLLSRPPKDEKNARSIIQQVDNEINRCRKDYKAAYENFCQSQNYGSPEKHRNKAIKQLKKIIFTSHKNHYSLDGARNKFIDLVIAGTLRGKKSRADFVYKRIAKMALDETGIGFVCYTVVAPIISSLPTDTRERIDDKIGKYMDKIQARRHKMRGTESTKIDDFAVDDGITQLFVRVTAEGTAATETLVEEFTKEQGTEETVHAIASFCW